MIYYQQFVLFLFYFYHAAPNFVLRGSIIRGITRPPILIPLDIIPKAIPRFFTNHNGTTLSAI